MALAAAATWALAGAAAVVIVHRASARNRRRLQPPPGLVPPNVPPTYRYGHVPVSDEVAAERVRRAEARRRGYSPSEWGEW